MTPGIKPFVAIITDNSALMSACQRALRDLAQIELKHFADAQAYIDSNPRPTSALLIDVKLSIQTKGVAKETLLAMEPHIPVLRVRLLDDGNVFSAWREHSGTTDEFIKNFILQQALNARPFQLRRYYRHSIHIPVLICRGEVFDTSKAIKAVTLNASPGGMYMVTNELFTMDEVLCFRIFNHDEIPALKLKVRWIQKWGETRKSLPGIGVMLVETNEPFMLHMANVNKMTK